MRQIDKKVKDSASEACYKDVGDGKRIAGSSSQSDSATDSNANSQSASDSGDSK